MHDFIFSALVHLPMFVSRVRLASHCQFVLAITRVHDISVEAINWLGCKILVIFNLIPFVNISVLTWEIFITILPVN